MILTGSAVHEYMARHSRFFKPKEFQCPCCGKITIDAILLDVLERLRVFIGRPVVITSGYRCEKHNLEIKGAKHSPHMRGHAVDIACPDSKTRFEILDFLITNNIQRIGIGKTFIHFDTAQGELYAREIVWTYYGHGNGGA